MTPFDRLRKIHRQLSLPLALAGMVGSSEAQSPTGLERGSAAPTTGLTKAPVPGRIGSHEEYFKRKQQLYQMAGEVAKLPLGSDIRAEALTQCVAIINGHNPADRYALRYWDWNRDGVQLCDGMTLGERKTVAAAIYGEKVANLATSFIPSEAEIAHAFDAATLLQNIKRAGGDVPKNARAGYPKAGVFYVPAKFEVEVTNGSLGATNTVEARGNPEVPASASTNDVVKTAVVDCFNLCTGGAFVMPSGKTVLFQRKASLAQNVAPPKSAVDKGFEALEAMAGESGTGTNGSSQSVLDAIRALREKKAQ